MAGRAYHQEAVLCVLDLNNCHTLDQLDLALDLPRKKIVNAILRLIFRGYVERIKIGCYRLTQAGEVSRATQEKLTSGPNNKLHRPRRILTGFRTRIWRAIGVKEKFTLRQLVASADPETEKNPLNNAGNFINALEWAGYIQRLPVREKSTALTSNGFIRYRRLKHTGPRCPQVRARSRDLYDPNTGEVFSSLCGV